MESAGCSWLPEKWRAYCISRTTLRDIRSALDGPKRSLLNVGFMHGDLVESLSEVQLGEPGSVP